MDDQSFEHIIEQLTDETDWLKRGRALRKLREYGTAVVPCLDHIFILLFDEKAPIRDLSAILIRNLGAAAVPYLLDKLDSEDSGERKEAIWLLLECGNRFCTTTRLIKQVLDERYSQLPEWGQPESIIFDHFHKCLTDPDLSVRFKAASALEEFGREISDTIPVFIETVISGSDHEQNWAALRLGRIGEPAYAACKALTAATASDYGYTRLAAKNALALILDKKEKQPE
ncbi:HEAT repeat domain-containing protein [Gimesia sp.]|uniref:HEAT repeat domain-containing protein n=1 Tax=Gimesia sp. TaxID=2024833 RepID=UPI003A919172